MREREKVYFSDPIQLLLNLFVLLLICKFAREAANQFKRVRHPNYENQKVKLLKSIDGSELLSSPKHLS